MGSTIRLPYGFRRRLDEAANALINPQSIASVNFAAPAGEAALLPPDSLSWRVFKNHVALYIGGIAAVILELADPAVRAGVWDHSSFAKAPMRRLQRTGLAAMVTVYGARSIAEPMIAGVVRRHANVVGMTGAGERYCANDEQLLTWVHATATFGFSEAYSRYVTPLSAADRDSLCREGTLASRLYGALSAPLSQVELLGLMDSARARLSASPVVFEFLKIMTYAPMLPSAVRWMQPMLIRAAVETLPDWIRSRLGLTEIHGLRAGEAWLVRLAGLISDRIVLPESPPARACVRLGLPATYLYS